MFLIVPADVVILFSSGAGVSRGGKCTTYNKCFDPWAAAAADDRARMVGEINSKTGECDSR